MPPACWFCVQVVQIRLLQAPHAALPSVPLPTPAPTTPMRQTCGACLLDTDAKLPLVCASGDVTTPKRRAGQSRRGSGVSR